MLCTFFHVIPAFAIVNPEFSNLDLYSHFGRQPVASITNLLSLVTNPEGCIGPLKFFHCFVIPLPASNSSNVLKQRSFGIG